MSSPAPAGLPGIRLPQNGRDDRAEGLRPRQGERPGDVLRGARRRRRHAASAGTAARRGAHRRAVLRSAAARAGRGPARRGARVAGPRPHGRHRPRDDGGEPRLGRRGAPRRTRHRAGRLPRLQPRRADRARGRGTTPRARGAAGARRHALPPGRLPRRDQRPGLTSPRLPTRADFQEMADAYAAVAPHPEHFQDFLAKVSHAAHAPLPWTADDLRGLRAPALLSSATSTSYASSTPPRCSG